MMQNAFNEILMFLPLNLQATLRNVPSQISQGVNEIRLRSNRPVALVCNRRTLFPDKFGVCRATVSAQLPRVPQNELEETVLLLCRNAVYRHQEELRQGFISLPGGHRAGVCGMGVFEDGRVQSLKEISSVNIRIARQIKGCSAPVSRRDVVGGLIIAGPPGSGKTTLLRDVVYRCSSGHFGEPLRVAVADERGEISGMYQGVPGLDIGLADVVCGIDKAHAVMMAVRTLNPQMVVFDEIGNAADAAAVAAASAAGVDYIATIHCDSYERLLLNPLFRRVKPHTSNVIHLGSTPGEKMEIHRLKEQKNEIVGSNAAGRGGDACGVAFCPQTA